MSDGSDHPFQEKPDWKGKLKQALRKSKDDVTGIFTRKEVSPLSPDANPGSDGHTMTDMLKMAWSTRVKPRFTKKKRKPANEFNPTEFPPGGGARPPIQFNASTLNTLTILIALVLIAWTGADLAAFFVDQWIPEPPVARSRGGLAPVERARPFADYQVIVSRNLFSSLGRIPGDQAPGIPQQENDPVKTGLPLNLIGTVILRNESRSVATLEDKGENQVYPVRIEDELPGKIKILSIEPYKVIFRNLANGRKEFVDMPEEGNAPRISVGSLSSRKPSPGGEGIEQTTPNSFQIARSELDKHLSNINDVLTQARAIPHFENGQPAGFKLIQIVPGSVFEKLGLKNGDILQGVNGEPVDAAKAFELLGALKTASQLELSVKRDGRASTMNYNFR